MSGRVVHFEVPTDDQDRAKNFYSSAFGWKLTPMPEMDYTTVVTTATGEQGMPSEPGAINGGMFHREGELSSPIVTVEVDDIDATLEKIDGLGGTTVTDKQEIPDMGFYAYFRDSEGNLMGLWQNPPS